MDKQPGAFAGRVAATLITAFAASAHPGSWGFTLGNGAGFYWCDQPRTTVYTTPTYVGPAPVYYQRPVVYAAPQTVYTNSDAPLY